MGKEQTIFEQRMKTNITNYTLAMLLGEKQTQMYFESFADLLKMDVLLVDRNGAEVAKVGNLVLDDINTDMEPGRTLIVQGRTMGRLYVKKASGDPLTMEEEDFMDATKRLFERMAGQIYFQKESTLYIDLQENSDNPGMKLHKVEKEDGLTGVFNRSYYENRVKIIDRSGVLPVALIFVNINDWKYANDHFGDDGSDRLIQIVAEILKKEAKEEYVIGRVDGDVFQVLIPMAEDGEAEDYAARVQASCNAYEDEKLAPSVAVGIQYKTNVEENLMDKVSDAEYEMFQNKFDVKNEPGYRERLEKYEHKIL